MKISVAMTTYNGEKYIQKQLISLLNQTRKADEIIIADDKSSDNTALIVGNFISDNKLDNWTYYVNNENLGFVKNFKNVISITTGDLIFLCDQDDIWLPEKIEELENLFEKNSKAMAINSSFNFINETDEPFLIPQKPNTSNQNIINYIISQDDFVPVNFNTIIRYNISPGCTMAFKSELKEKLLSQNVFEIPHDWEINLYATMWDGLYFLNKPLINYRIHSSNTIGLITEDDKPALKIHGNLKKRLNVLDCMINLYGLLLTPEFLEKFDRKEKQFVIHSSKFSALRLKVIKEKKLSAWFKLWVHAPFLKQGNTIKMILGDLVFMFNLHK